MLHSSALPRSTSLRYILHMFQILLKNSQELKRTDSNLFKNVKAAHHGPSFQSRGALRIFVYGGVHMEGKIQTQKPGFPENFAPKNIGILHISYPKIWVKIVF